MLEICNFPAIAPASPRAPTFGALAPASMQPPLICCPFCDHQAVAKFFP
jgi:hypothetical protein